MKDLTQLQQMIALDWNYNHHDTSDNVSEFAEWLNTLFAQPIQELGFELIDYSHEELDDISKHILTFKKPVEACSQAHNMDDIMKKAYDHSDFEDPMPHWRYSDNSYITVEIPYFI